MKRSKDGIFVGFCAVCFLLIYSCALNNSAQIRDGIDKKKSSDNSPTKLRQNQSTPKKYKIRQEIFPYKIGDAVIEIVVSRTSRRTSKFVYINLHDNENTSVDAAKETIQKFGGTLVELQHGGERLIKFSLKDSKITFDPNRIFTAGGIKKTLKSNGDNPAEAEREVAKFAGKLESYLKNIRLVIAVHNNTDGNYSIKSYDKGGEFETDAKLVNVNSDLDNDDFFYVTEDDFFKYLTKKKQNVAFQDNAKVNDDGSLSVYCGKNKIPYINVESENGHLPEQTKMLEILQRLTKNLNRNEKKTRRK